MLDVNALATVRPSVKFSTEETDYWWWLMQNADVNSARLILAVLDDPAWKDELAGKMPGNVELYLCRGFADLEAALGGRRFDLVIIANVLRLESASQARTLIARVADAVAPAGALLIIDAFAAGSEAAELARTVYALHLALRTEAGRVHSPKDISAWMSDAGFGNLKMVDLDPNMAAVGALIGWC